MLYLGVGMILKGADIRRYCAQPDFRKAGFLIAGADPVLVYQARHEVIAALIGPQGEAEMRLKRIHGTELRKDKTILLDAVKEIGFFQGTRVVFVEEATDALSAQIQSTLEEWRPGDAIIIVTAGALPAKSTLRSLFERGALTAFAMLYDTPMERQEIKDEFKKEGVPNIDTDALESLFSWALVLDRGDFRQFIKKLALYKYNDATALSVNDVIELQPLSVDSEAEDLLNAVADRRPKDVVVLFQRFTGQPVALCIQALRYFKMLHLAAVSPGGVHNGLQKARLFGPRRDRAQRQLHMWKPHQLEAAVSQLLEADFSLRSSTRAPAMAALERVLIRIAMTV